MTLDITKVRSYFPALYTGFFFGDNAAGAQVAQQVIDRVVNYFTFTYVQPMASYPASVIAAHRLLVEGPEAAAQLFNARSREEIVWGMSTTANIENITRGMEEVEDVHEGDEFIITLEHEANTLPWKQLAPRVGAVLKYWIPRRSRQDNPYAVEYHIEDLVSLITAKTRVVAFTAASNISGVVIPVKDVAIAIKEAGRRVGAPKIETVLDAVGYAPHRMMDVQDWGVDYAVFSYYKVFAGHISPLYTRPSNLRKTFPVLIPDYPEVNNKIQFAGPAYELLYSSSGVIEYLRSLSPSSTLRETFDLITAYDQTLSGLLLGFLTAPTQRARGVRVVGREEPGVERLPTICFVVVGDQPMPSKDIAEAINREDGVGVQHGRFGAADLLNELKIEGVVRISLVHYNTVREVEKIIGILKKILNV